MMKLVIAIDIVHSHSQEKLLTLFDTSDIEGREFEYITLSE